VSPEILTSISELDHDVSDGIEIDQVRELAQEGWGEYLDALSKELLNAEVSIEIVGKRAPPVVQTEHAALQALRYDRRSDVLEVAVPRLVAIRGWMHRSQ